MHLAGMGQQIQHIQSHLLKLGPLFLLVPMAAHLTSIRLARLAGHRVDMDMLLWIGADITDTTQTTIIINSASADPIFCGILIQIDSEQMQVESLSGTSTLTVFRAACGTTAATHAKGAVVTMCQNDGPGRHYPNWWDQRSKLWKLSARIRMV